MLECANDTIKSSRSFSELLEKPINLAFNPTGGSSALNVWINVSCNLSILVRELRLTHAKLSKTSPEFRSFF